VIWLWAFATSVCAVSLVDRAYDSLVDLTMPWRFDLQRDRNVFVEMRDGVKLRTHVLKPLGGDQERYPVVLFRTTYAGFSFEWARFFVDQGYAVVQQYVHARYGSEGENYDPHRRSRQDGYDTIDWIARQPWSNGRVGTFGCSFLGENQLIAAATGHPAHRALIADGAGGAVGNAMGHYGYFGVFDNGVLNLASALGWFAEFGSAEHNVTPTPTDLPDRLKQVYSYFSLTQMADEVVPYRTGFDDLVSHNLTDAWWNGQGYLHDSDRFSTAGLHVNSWYDQTTRGTFVAADLMRNNAINERAKSQNVLVGPGLHCSNEDLNKGKQFIGEMSYRISELPFKKAYLAWFDYWLKGEGKKPSEGVDYFVIHADQWKHSDYWPPRDVHTKTYFLSASGELSVEKPVAENSISFVYDPSKPTPSLGGAICCTGNPEERAGALDQRPLLKRNDVLFFSGPPMSNATDLVGSAKLSLNVSSSATDTDFVVKLLDIYPSGEIYNLSDGVMRLRYRDGVSTPNLAEPGQVYELSWELSPIAYRFRKGHRFGLMVSSSDYPRLERNTNTPVLRANNSDFIVAENTLHFGGNGLSRLTLPMTQH